nr:hypothetical protein [Gryllotalpicola ginsengisoli]
MAALLLMYIVLAGQRAVLLLSSGSVWGVIGGLALLVFPLIALWALWRELLFGWRTEQLVRRLDAEGGLPVEPATDSRQAARAAADAEFPRFKADVEADPASWRAWFRLGLAYDASGDRRRARWALREAIRLSRASG